MLALLPCVPPASDTFQTKLCLEELWTLYYWNLHSYFKEILITNYILWVRKQRLRLVKQFVGGPKKKLNPKPASGTKVRSECILLSPHRVGSLLRHLPLNKTTMHSYTYSMGLHFVSTGFGGWLMLDWAWVQCTVHIFQHSCQFLWPFSTGNVNL